MYELKQLGPQSYYIESPAKIGIYKQNDTDIYLIDSGNDKEAGKKVVKIANQNNWRIKAIINTHSNADTKIHETILQICPFSINPGSSVSH